MILTSNSLALLILAVFSSGLEAIRISVFFEIELVILVPNFSRIISTSLSLKPVKTIVLLLNSLILSEYFFNSVSFSSEFTA